MSNNPLPRERRRGPRHRKPKSRSAKGLGFLAAGLSVALIGVLAYGGVGFWRSEELTVWLMDDAKDGWSKVVKAANSAFEQQHPGVDVTVRYQDWSEYLAKFEKTLEEGNPPDVIEMGNTQTVSYMASGALLELTDKVDSFDNSWSWLHGLQQSCTYQGRLYCVPYYAASRAVIYRKDMFEQAGIADVPSSLEELTKAADKLMAEYGDRENFSALYFPGKYWYYAMSFVYDYGGQIAKRVDGKWVGALDSRAARTGLKKLEQIVSAYSAAPKRADAAEQAKVVANGNVAMFYGLEWETALVTDEKTGPKLEGKLGVFAMPSHKPGKTMPSFLGGSDLAVPAASDSHELALDWIRTFTSNRSMRMLVRAGGVLPNTTKLLDLAERTAEVAAFAAAARQTWFVPTAKNWATVEKKGVLADMLVDIFTGAATVEEATARASRRITRILNGR